MSIYRYPKETKRYYFYLTDEQNVFVSNRAVFLEKEFLGGGTNASNIELDEVRSVEELTQSSKLIESDLIRSNPKSIIETSLRRSDRGSVGKCVPNLIVSLLTVILFDVIIYKLINQIFIS